MIRAAYTLSSYLEGTGTNLRLTINPPFAHETDANYTSMALPTSTLSQGFLPLEANPADPFAGALIRLWDPNVRPAVSNQWNFTVQRQFAGNTTLQVGYVGQRTTHLMVPMPYFQKELNPDGTSRVARTFPGIRPSRTRSARSRAPLRTATRPTTPYRLCCRSGLSNGLEYSVAYTYSKCMTDSSGYYGSWGGQTTPTSPYWQNLYDQKAEWGPCYYDVTHVLTSYATYDLPFGRDRQFGKNMNPVVNAVAGDWQVNAILSLHTGFALTTSGPDASGTNSRGARARLYFPG